MNHKVLLVVLLCWAVSLTLTFHVGRNTQLFSFNPASYPAEEVHRVEVAGNSALRLRRLNPPVQMLVLTSWADFTNRMDRFLYDLVDAGVEADHVNLTVWGPGYVHWNETLSPRDNIDAFLGCENLDIVYTHLIHWGMTPCGGAVHVHELGDCHRHACRGELNPNGNVTISRYAFELPELFSYDYLTKQHEGFRMHLFAHNPDCAPSLGLDSEVPFDERPVDAYLIGAVSEFYPLRSAVRDAVEAGELPAVTRFTHPGYQLQGPDAPEVGPLGYRPGLTEPYMANIKHARETYITALHRTKICIFDSSVERKLIRKFAESMLAGCVPASDLPFELTQELKDVVIELDPTWSHAQLRHVLDQHLQDPVELQRRSVRGKALASTLLSCQSKLNRVLEAADRYLSGQRGYWFPFGYFRGCKKYWFWKDENEVTNMWCHK